MPLIWEQLNNTKISTAAQEIIMASWRTGTSKQYHTYLSRWKRFCDQRQINHSDASVENGIDFLALLFQDGLGYSAINTARSALSTVLNTTSHTSFGTHPLVVRFLKGVFELKPSLPRYASIWDVGFGLGLSQDISSINGVKFENTYQEIDHIALPFDRSTMSNSN